MIGWLRSRVAGLAQWREDKAAVIRERGVVLPLAEALLAGSAKISLSRALNKYAERRWPRSDGKAPPWASELYVVLATGAILVGSLVPNPASPCSYLGLAAVGYVNAELARTLLAWVLTERDEPVHSLGRSFLLFGFNAIQIALSAAGAERLLGVGDVSLSKVWSHLVAIVSLDGSLAAGSEPMVTALRFCLGSLLILITLAALVGGFARWELPRA